MHRLPPLLLLVALLTTNAPAFGQTYKLAAYVIGSGAMNGSSTNFQAMGTVGQPAIGFGTSTNFQGSWGFWHTLAATSGGAGVLADLKVLLEGPYSGGGMMLANQSSYIPTHHPFGGPPWNYAGVDSVGPTFFASNPDVVDWILIEVREETPGPASPPMSVAGTRAGFLKTDGTVVDTSGTEPVQFPGIPAGTYYVVVHHRNHLGIMSASGVATSSDTLGYDFTDALAKAYSGGGTAMRSLAGGKFGMFTGDADADGQVGAFDFNAWLTQTKAVTPGYLTSDFNLDGMSTASDFNAWLTNTKAVVSSQVPPN